MKYFIIEGILKNPQVINDEIMKEHMAYTGKAMESGLILMSGLKEDMSGGIFFMKSESQEQIEDYLSNEPFKKYDIQEYKVTSFQPHYVNENSKEFLE